MHTFKACFKSEEIKLQNKKKPSLTLSHASPAPSIVHRMSSFCRILVRRSAQLVNAQASNRPSVKTKRTH